MRNVCTCVCMCTIPLSRVTISRKGRRKQPSAGFKETPPPGSTLFHVGKSREINDPVSPRGEIPSIGVRVARVIARMRSHMIKRICKRHLCQNAERLARGKFSLENCLCIIVTIHPIIVQHVSGGRLLVAIGVSRSSLTDLLTLEKLNLRETLYPSGQSRQR